MKLTNVIALGCVVLVGCGSNPEDLFTFVGRVVSASGAPLDNHAVVLTRSTPVAGFSARTCSELKPVVTTETNDGGSYSFSLFRVQLFSAFDPTGSPHCVRLDTTIDGARSRFEVIPRSQRFEGDLEEWVPGAQLTSGDASETSMRLNLPQGGVREELARAELQVRLELADGGLAFNGGYVLDVETLGTTTQLSFGSPILEDFGGALRLTYASRTKSESTSFQVARPRGQGTFLFQPAASLIVQGTRVPVSRMATCGSSPCALTDGDLQVLPLSNRAQNFTLPRPAVIQHVVIRGITPSFAVDDVELVNLDTGERRTIVARSEPPAGEGPRPPRPLFPLDDDDATVGFVAYSFDSRFSSQAPMDAGVRYQVSVAAEVVGVAEISLFEAP